MQKECEQPGNFRGSVGNSIQIGHFCSASVPKELAMVPFDESKTRRLIIFNLVLHVFLSEAKPKAKVDGVLKCFCPVQVVGFGTLRSEKVQNRAARFVTGNYVFETGSMTDILGQLKWKSLKKRRKDSRLIFLYIQRSEG